MNLSRLSHGFFGNEDLRVPLGKASRTSHCSRFDLEGLFLLHRGAPCQSHAKSFVHYRVEWASGPSCFGLKASSDINTRT
jgi:hypothetical protein